LHFPSLAACDYLFIASQFRTPTCPEYVPPQAEWILALIARAAVDHCAVHIDPALIARWPVGNNLTAILHSAMAPVLEKIGK